MEIINNFIEKVLFLENINNVSLTIIVYILEK